MDIYNWSLAVSSALLECLAGLSRRVAGAGAEAEEGADSASTRAAYLSKMQMLRELGFLAESSPEAEAQARSQQQAADAQAATSKSADSAELATFRAGEMLKLPQEAGSGMPAAEQGLLPARALIKGRPGLKSDEQRCCHDGSS